MTKIVDFLASFKGTKIATLQIAEKCPELTYEEFANSILQLEKQGVLTAVKASGINGKQPVLANTYKINKMRTRQNVQQHVKQLKKVMHPAIFIEYYLTKKLDELEHDLPALQQLNHYLTANGFPKMKALAQERSFEIVHDEKWIAEQGGKQLLEKVKVWDLLEIWPIADPVSFAVHPERLQDERPKLLIIENKATFYNLLPALKESAFAALIYGQGNAINGTFQMLPEQLPLNYENAQFYYFGDIDAEGISIWYSLQQKCPAKLALPFYRACLQKGAAKGKEYQRKKDVAIEAFNSHFTRDEAIQITGVLQQGFYYPQEILKAEELQQIWRDASWT